MALGFKERGTSFSALLIFLLFSTANVMANDSLPSDFEENSWNCIHLIDLHRDRSARGDVWTEDALELLKEQVLAAKYQQVPFDQLRSVRQASRFVEKFIESYEESRGNWERSWQGIFLKSPAIREKYLMKCYVHASEKTRKLTYQKNIPVKRKPKEQPYDGP